MLRAPFANATAPSAAADTPLLLAFADCSDMPDARTPDSPIIFDADYFCR